MTLLLIMSSIVIVRGVPKCGISYDDSRGVIYNLTIFITQATGWGGGSASVGFNKLKLTLKVKIPLVTKNYEFEIELMSTAFLFAKLQF